MRRLRRGGSLRAVGAATALASAAGYTLLVLSGRLLQPAAFGVFLAFWGIVFGLGSALSSVEQEVARQSAVAATAGGQTGREAAQVVAVAAALAALLPLPLLAPALSHRLLGGEPLFVPFVVLAGVGFALQFGLRGLLLGHSRVSAYSKIIVAEAALRLLALVAVVAVGPRTAVSLAAAVAAGSLAWLLFLPAARGLAAASGQRSRWLAVGRRVGTLVSAAVLTAAVVTGYPTLVAALVPELRGAPLGAFFAALTVSRVPLLAVSPLQALTVPAVVRALARPDGRARVRRLLLVGLASAVGIALAVAGIGAAVGPRLVTLLYGSSYQVASGTVAALLASAVGLGVLLLLSSVLIALESYPRVAAVWGSALAVTAAVLACGLGSGLDRATFALLVGPGAALGVALRGVGRRLGSDG